MRKVPAEFEELLSPRGRRVLSGKDPRVCGQLAEPDVRFIGLPGMLDAKKATALRDLIDRSLRDALTPMEDPIPAWTIRAMEQNYAELLPKTVRVHTA
ncbi:MAG: hypothetical protein WBV82_04220, partial [Myxococcaceae bacterium]